MKFSATPRELLLRFLTGGLTSVLAGVVSLVFGPRVGGVFLAFPAILAASLTLIAKEEGRDEAREDAHGAIVGGVAMVAFALVVMLLARHLAGGLAIVLAAVAWLLVALGGYAALWWR